MKKPIGSMMFQDFLQASPKGGGGTWAPFQTIWASRVPQKRNAGRISPQVSFAIVNDTLRRFGFIESPQDTYRKTPENPGTSVFVAAMAVWGAISQCYRAALAPPE